MSVDLTTRPERGLARRFSRESSPPPPPQPQPLPAVLPAHGDLLAAILRELNGIAFLLDDRNDHSDFAPAAIVVTNEARQMRIQRDWPIPGGQRFIVPSRGFGGQFAVNGAFVQLLTANAARIGGMISTQAAALVLYLGSQQSIAAGQAVPQVYLGANGQWNLKLSDVVWAGDVWAFGITAQASVAEV